MRILVKRLKATSEDDHTTAPPSSPAAQSCFAIELVMIVTYAHKLLHLFALHASLELSVLSGRESVDGSVKALRAFLESYEPLHFAGSMEQVEEYVEGPCIGRRGKGRMLFQRLPSNSDDAGSFWLLTSNLIGDDFQKI